MTLGTLLPASVAYADGTHGIWEISGTTPTVNGSLQFAAFGFRGGSWSTNGGAPATPVAAFLNATTPYGAVFGSTQGSNYLSAGASSGGQPSTTTITLDSPSPPNTWGFNLGDIDADQMLIQATGPGGPLTAAQLGFQGTFNYCTPTTPRPASCGGLAHTDVPTWNPATSTLTGTGTDTQGASGWFRPTVPVTSITLTYSVLTGIPSFQLWTSVLVWDISGSVTLDTGGPPPAGTEVRLLDANGAFVDDIVFGGDDEDYGFDGVAAAPYTVQVIPPAGYEVVGASSRPADATNGDVADVDFVLRLTPPTTTTTTTTTSTTTTTTTTTTTIPSTTSSSTSTSTTDPGSTTTSTTNPGSSTSTSSSTSTTVAQATTTTRGGGRLPATGNSGSNSIVAFGAILAACGVAFFLVARRSH